MANVPNGIERLPLVDVQRKIVMKKYSSCFYSLYPARMSLGADYEQNESLKLESFRRGSAGEMNCIEDSVCVCV